MDESNGSKFLSYKGLVGVLISVALLSTGAYLRWIQAKIEDLSNLSIVRGERLSILETNSANLQKQLDGINIKLDKLLDSRGIK